MRVKKSPHIKKNGGAKGKGVKKSRNIGDVVYGRPLMQTLRNVMQCLHCSTGGTGNCEHDKRQVFIRKNETVKFGPHHTFILGSK